MIFLNTIRSFILHHIKRYAASRPSWTFDKKRPEYATRYLVLDIPLFTVYLHNIKTPDTRNQLHDHPWRWCFTLILAGGYTEDRLVNFDPAQPVGLNLKLKRLRPGHITWLKPTTFHTVSQVSPDTWTLCVHGKKCKRWGFLTCGVKEIEGVTPLWYYVPAPERTKDIINVT